MNKFRKNEIAKNILQAIGLAGLLVVVFTLPGIAEAFRPFFNTNKGFKDKQVQRSLNYLRSTKLISVSFKNEKTEIRLTKNGKEKLLNFQLEDMQMVKPKNWDKKWRLVIFDIPETLKQNRKSFAGKLKELGFLQLQKSVWVWPYECENEVDFLKEVYFIRNYVRVVRADYIDISSDLIKRFNLA